MLRPNLLPLTSMDWSRRLAAEAIGTALLLAAVVGSGIRGERLAGGNVAIALMANTIATGAALDSRRDSRSRCHAHRIARLATTILGDVANVRSDRDSESGKQCPAAAVSSPSKEDASVLPVCTRGSGAV